jgi:hypothetical protein
VRRGDALADLANRYHQGGPPGANPPTSTSSSTSPPSTAMLPTWRGPAATSMASARSPEPPSSRSAAGPH